MVRVEVSIVPRPPFNTARGGSGNETRLRFTRTEQYRYLSSSVWLSYTQSGEWSLHVVFMCQSHAVYSSEYHPLKNFDGLYEF